MVYTRCQPHTFLQAAHIHACRPTVQGKKIDLGIRFCIRPLLQGALRTKETIERFKQVPAQPGTTNPLLVYFGTLLQKGQLNAFESVELSRLVMGQNKKHLLDGWFKEGKVGLIA